MFVHLIFSLVKIQPAIRAMLQKELIIKIQNIIKDDYLKS